MKEAKHPNKQYNDLAQVIHPLEPNIKHKYPIMCKEQFYLIDQYTQFSITELAPIQ